MTATIRKQIQRSRLVYSGGKRLDLYLTKDEHEALDAFRMALNLPSLTDAVKALIEPFLPNPGGPLSSSLDDLTPLGHHPPRSKPALRQ